MTQVTFADLGLAQPLQDTLVASGYTQPTPIQAAAIPSLLARRDVMASAATGTGKTAAFMLPALNFLMEKSEKPGRGPRILILSPTRELAAQIKTAAETYGKQVRHAKVVSIVGGMPYPLQIKLLSSPFEILVATPGRLLDMIARGRLDFSRLEMLVLDEADRMLDLGFRDDIAEIAAKLPAERVTALFSATLDEDISRIAADLLNNPERIEVAAPERRQEQIVEKLHYADDITHKTKLLDRILEDESVNQAIIFIATKIDADSLADKLLADGKKVAALHGDMQQRERQRTLNRLKKGEIDILVATDVAARGIDVAGITHVVNFDLPKFAEDYVHRIGRTGRAGREGTAISFAAKHEVPALRRIEKFVGRSLVSFKFEGLESRFEPRSGSSGGGKGRFGGGQGGRREGGFGGNRGGFDRQPRDFGGAPRTGGFGDRPQGERSFGGERKFGDRPQGERSFGGERKFGDRPQGERSFGGDRKFADRGPRTGFDGNRVPTPRDASGEPDGNRRDIPPTHERRSVGQFNDRPRTGGFGANRGTGTGFGGERKFGDRPQGERSFGGERKFGDRPQGDRKFGDRPSGDRKFGDRPQGERKFGDRPQGERRSFGDNRSSRFPGAADFE